MTLSTSTVETETTTFALSEKAKLVKSLGRFDMWFFTVCAFVGLDTLGTVAKNGPYEWTKLAFGRFHGAIAAILYWVTNPLWVGVAIISLRYGKWIPNLGAILRAVVLGFFSITMIVYGIKHGVAGFTIGSMSPTRAVFFALVPVLLFNYVGFELQNGAAEEMENPKRDVPLSILRSGITGVLMYVVPVLCIILVLPASKVTGIGGFIDAHSSRRAPCG
jgi:glutamate:GABA antiporter